MPRAKFEGMAASDPRFSSKLYEAVSADLRRTYDLALTVGQRDSESSLAAFLLEMHARTNSDAWMLSLQMPRSDIADYLGVTTETVSRTFSKFAKRGLIDLNGRRDICLKDFPALERLAEGLVDKRSGRLLRARNRHLQNP
jgi:CRP-like cAMP-binding protein